MAQVLIVEDEALIADLLASYLEELGHSVVAASTVAQALSLIEADLPDFSILDLSLGREQSIPVAEVLRQRHSPFAFATGYGAGALPEGFKSSAIIAKPFVFEDILRLTEKFASA